MVSRIKPVVLVVSPPFAPPLPLLSLVLHVRSHPARRRVLKAPRIRSASRRSTVFWPFPILRRPVGFWFRRYPPSPRWQRRLWLLFRLGAPLQWTNIISPEHWTVHAAGRRHGEEIAPIQDISRDSAKDGEVCDGANYSLTHLSYLRSVRLTMQTSRKRCCGVAFATSPIR